MKDLPIDSNDSLAPHVALVAVQLFFGSAAVLGKAALQTFSSHTIVGFRVGVAKTTVIVKDDEIYMVNLMTVTMIATTA